MVMDGTYKNVVGVLSLECISHQKAYVYLSIFCSQYPAYQVYIGDLCTQGMVAYTFTMHAKTALMSLLRCT